MDNQIHNTIVSFIWGIADDCLRDVYVRGKYRDVILPMTVIRRLDAMLEDSKKAVLDMKKKLDEARIDNQWPALCNVAGQAFCNASPFRLRDLTSRAKKQTLKADFEAYLDGFSPNVQEILEKFRFRNQIDTMIEADILGAVIEKFRNCSTAYTEMPFIYPVYYSNSRYDATNYALSLYVVDMALGRGINIPQSTIDLIMAQNMWEAERVTLIKKKCHENDEEWRMIRPRMHGMRTFIKARPRKIILGLRMPEYERRLVISAAKVAGIQEIHEMYINDSDELDSRPMAI